MQICGGTVEAATKRTPRKHQCANLAGTPELDLRGCAVRPWTNFFFFFNVALFDLKRSEIGPDLVRYGPIRSDSVRYGTKYWLKKRKRKRLDQNTLFCRQALKETTLKSSKFSLYYLLLFLN